MMFFVLYGDFQWAKMGKYSNFIQSIFEHYKDTHYFIDKTKLILKVNKYSTSCEKL